MVGARLFVIAVFTVLAASFWAASALVIWEFWDTDWITVVLAHSHLFLFFPIFGVLVLSALLLPATVFTHFYWTQVPFGRVRFGFGFLVCALASIYFANGLLESPVRGVWEVAPKVLLADRGDPQGCGEGRAECRRAPILGSLLSLRDVAQSRIGLSKFARACRPDPLMELPEDYERQRYCAATLGKATTAVCCQAQARLRSDLARMRNNPVTRSLTSQWDVLFLPLKSFFVIVVVLVGVLLAVWRNRLDEHYGELVARVERGMLVAGFSMLLWPLMDYGYQQVSNAMLGRIEEGLQLRLSLVMVPWGLLLLFHFLRRMGERIETIGQIAGIVASAIAILRYENIVDWSARLFGIGTEWWMLVLFAVLTVVGFAALIVPWRISEQAARMAIQQAARPGRDLT